MWRGVSFLQLVIGMQQQHLMQMNQSMMGGYASSTTVTTDLIQQVISSSPKSLSLFFLSFFLSCAYIHTYPISISLCLSFLAYSSFIWFLFLFSCFLRSPLLYPGLLFFFKSFAVSFHVVLESFRSLLFVFALF